MIGGADIVLFGQTMPQDADLILRSIRTEWPSAMVQEADSSAAVPFSQIRFPIVGPHEFIVYRDIDSFQSWQASGATPDNQDAMLHIIITRESITIVADRSDSALASLAREILASVSRNRITFNAA